MALVEVFVEPEEAQSQQHLIRTHEDKSSASAKIVVRIHNNGSGARSSFMHGTYGDVITVIKTITKEGSVTHIPVKSKDMALDSTTPVFGVSRAILATSLKIP